MEYKCAIIHTNFSVAHASHASPGKNNNNEDFFYITILSIEIIIFLLPKKKEHI